MKFLAIFECPCIGTNEELIYAVDSNDADKKAWERTLEVKEYVPGGYDLYMIDYNNRTHRHELIPVIPEDMEVD